MTTPNHSSCHNFLRIRELGGSGKRSRVFLTSCGNDLFVEKHFPSGASCPYFRNELRARDVLRHPAVAPIVARLEDGFIMPYYPASRPWNDDGRTLYPVDRARRVMQFMAWLAAQGFAMQDWHPGAFLFDESDALRVIDFEYLAEILPAFDFRMSPDFRGEDVFCGASVPLRKKGYRYMWKPALGLSYESLMRDGPAVLAVKRSLFFACKKFPSFLYKRAEGAAKRLCPLSRTPPPASQKLCGAGLSEKEAMAADRYFSPSDHMEFTDAPPFKPPENVRYRPLALPHCVKRNNADVLMLAGKAIWATRRYDAVGAAKRLYVPLSWELALFLPAFLRYVMRGQLRFDGAERIPLMPKGRKIWLSYVPSRRKFRRGPRFYVRDDIPLCEFFADMRKRDIRYVLLRGHETLDALAADEDVDILAADADVEKALAFFDEKLGTRPLDLYSPSGARHTDYHGISYYPPYFAEEILEGRILDGASGAYVPAPQDALDSYAYHLLFHKGQTCGLPKKAEAKKAPVDAFKNKYADYLRRKCADAGVSVPEDMAGLAEYLSERDLLPPEDTIGRISVYNSWVRKHFAVENKLRRHPPGAVAFIVRALAKERGVIGEIVSMIESCGFIALAQGELSPADVARVARQIRGGNWHKGIDRIDSGAPNYFVLAYDPYPIPPTAAERKEYPRVDNARILKKADIRREIARRYFDGQKTSVVHTSDNSDEAMHYADLVSPESTPLLQEAIKKRG
ncbi:MAG: hypothetical protein ABW189_06600 [Rickettsiales bacterium]